MKQTKNLATDLFTELKAADRLPAGAKKGHYCTEGFAAKDAQFENGQRILDLAQQQGHASDYIDALQQAMQLNAALHSCRMIRITERLSYASAGWFWKLQSIRVQQDVTISFFVLYV